MNRDILALDFYGNTVTAALASLDPSTDTMRVRYVTRKPCRFFAGGFVRDMAGAKRELIGLLSDVALYSTEPSVVVGVRGPFLSFQHRTGFATVMSRGRIIRDSDIDEVIKSAVPANLSENLEVLDILPLSFNVDGNTNITDPKGMMGMTLEVEAFVSYAMSSHLANLNNVLMACGCNDFQLLPTVVALGETLLTPAEKDGTTLLLDIGEISTSALLYREGILMDGWELDFGFDELVKTVADILLNDEETTRTVLLENPPKTDKYTDELWEDGTDALLTRIKDELLQSFSFLQKNPTHLVISGSAANSLLTKAAKKIFSARKARLAVFDDLISDCETNKPDYNGALAVLQHALAREQENMGVAQVKETGFFNGLLAKLGLNSLF